MPAPSPWFGAFQGIDVSSDPLGGTGRLSAVEGLAQEAKAREVRASKNKRMVER